MADAGVQELNNHKFYFPDSSLNRQTTYKRWFREPVYFLDHEDNIWIGFGYGEWGGDLFVFNIPSRHFIIPRLGNFNIELNPVKSICSDGEKVFVSTGLQHREFSGSIIEFDHFLARTILASRLEMDMNNKPVEGEYIGPATFNKADHSIYFYSQNGIFKGNPEKDLSAVGMWEKVVSPELYWSSGQPDAIGSPMNVLKMEFANEGTLVFLSQLNGVGIYDGKTITLIR